MPEDKILNVYQVTFDFIDGNCCKRYNMIISAYDENDVYEILDRWERDYRTSFFQWIVRNSSLRIEKMDMSSPSILSMNSHTIFSKEKLE
jgi:hypothetical protein